MSQIIEEIARGTLRRTAKQSNVLEPEEVERHLRIVNKKGVLVPFVLNPVQEHYRTHRGQRNLCLKSRQQGISAYIQRDMFTEAVCRLSQQATLAHDTETTAKLRRIARRFYDCLPEDIRPHRTLDNATTTVYANTQSEVTIATAGNLSVGRGGTYRRVHGSEVAFWPDASLIMAGLLQGVPDDGEIDLESTPNGAQGYFYERCMAALSGDKSWRLFFYPWWMTPEYRVALEEGEELVYSDEEAVLVAEQNLVPEQILWRRQKQMDLRHLFPQEYPEHPKKCFLLSGLGYFGDISGCFNAVLNPDYDPDHVYYAGLDFGQSDDYTVLSIWDKTAKCQVACLRIRHLGWAEMRRMIREYCVWWQVNWVSAEENSIGSVNLEAMRAEFEASGCQTRIIAFRTTNISKAAVMGDLYEALHTDGYRLQPLPDQQREFEAFSSKQLPSGVWQLQASGEEHDDYVIANALACHACLRPAAIAFEIG